MKNKTIALIVMSLLIALSSMNVVAYAADTSLATVAFEEGVLEFDNAGLRDMDIDFGTHTLPVGASTYGAVDGDHTLRVLDARASAGGWYVTVELSAFDSITPAVTNTFNGIITMTAPSTTDGLNAVTPLVIASTAAATGVVTADTGLHNGTYDTTWAMANIEMSIDMDAAASIVAEADYEAVMTWTLTAA